MSHLDFCPACGTRFDEEAATCRNCGAARPDAEATAVEEGSAHEADAAALEALTAELAEALTPKLQLLRPLGQGGMGTVFLARDPALKRLVVVKVLSPDLAHDEHARRRFEREAESAAAVAHPNVVGVFQVGRLPQSGTSYFVMQYVDGQTLADAFPIGTVVPVQRARRIVGEVAAALAAAHARGVVHRDIKPANVMLERDSDRVVVLDFGISAAISPERRASAGTKITQMGTSIGTPQYMSPEQAAAGELTDRSDVYSLGVVAYELLAGRAVFEETTPMALAAAHINKTPAPVATVRPDVDAPFAQLVDQCLAKAPSARPSAEQVVRSLGAATGPTIEWPPPGLDALHGLGTRLSRALAVVVAVVVSFFALLFYPPWFGSARWLEGELSGLWLTVGGGCCPFNIFYTPVPKWDPTPVWQFLLVLLAIAEAALAAFAMAQAYRVYTLVVRARRSGYPVSVCLDVAFDGHRDTASLVNGAGAFASLAEPVRERVRRWRRQRAAIVALAPVVTAVLAVAWLVLASSGGAHPERVVSAAAFALLLLPLGAGLVAYALLAAREGSAVPQARLPWRQWLGRRRQPLVIRDVAAHWLRSADEAEPVRIGRDRWALAGAHGVLGLLLVCLVLTLALVAYVSFSASMTVALHRGAADEFRDERLLRAQAWQKVDSAVHALGLLPAPTPPDTGAAAMVVRLMTSDSLASEESRLWNVLAGTPAVSLPGYARGWSAEWELRGIMFANDTLSLRLRREIESNVTSPAYQAWRRFARGAQPPPAWYFTPEFGGLRSIAVLGHSWRLAYLQGPRATALGEILLAAERGDRARALATVGELLGAGLTLAREPITSAALEGISAVSDGLLALRFLARRAGDPGLEARAENVRKMLPWDEATTDHEVSPKAPILLTSDPASASTREALAGFFEPATQYRSAMRARPVDRWRLISAVAPAFCISPREVLLGLDPLRGAALASALGQQKDLPRRDEWIRANLRWFAQLRDDPGSAGIEVPWPLKPLGWVGLGKLRDRIAFCRQYVWY
jgi:predicted Ser/Thr protein kinase